MNSEEIEINFDEEVILDEENDEVENLFFYEDFSDKSMLKSK